jgi:DNA-binding transcriptional ArsR family regulator
VRGRAAADWTARCEYAQWYIYTAMQLDAFQTLADPTRRRIVEALRGGEQQVNDIVQKAGIHQSGVSRHLRILHESGFVSVRPDGQRRLYALRPEPFRELDAWLADYRQLWSARLDRFGAALEERQKNRGAGKKKERGK